MRVVVVGGGLAGLFTTTELLAAGVSDVLLVDRNQVPGGVARTVERDGFSLEPGAGSFNLPDEHLSPILGRIGAEVRPAEPGRSKRFVYVGGRLVDVPASPAVIAAPLLPVQSKLRALLEPFVGSKAANRDESLASFCTRRFGKKAGSLVSWLMASGVFAGDPQRLSVGAAFPGLRDLEEGHGSVIRGALARRKDRPEGAPRPEPHVPIGGMTALAEAAVSYLGERYRPGFEVQSVEPEAGGWKVEGPEELSADAVVLACDPGAASALVPGELSKHLAWAKTAPVVVVGLGGKVGSIPSGFGALIGPDEGMVSLGMLFESSYAAHRAPTGSWMVKVIAGGAVRPDVVDWDDSRLLGVVIDELSRVVGGDLNVSYSEVARPLPGIPQYELGHSEWMASLDRLLEDMPGLFLTGWGYRGVGVSHVARDAHEVASKIARV